MRLHSVHFFAYAAAVPGQNGNEHSAEHMFSEWPLIGNWIGHAVRKASRAAIVAISLVFGAGVLISNERRSGPAVAIVGGVRATEVRVEPEVNGQLMSIAVGKGAYVRTGDVLARLSAVELTAQADQARAALASATANRNNVYAGVRREQVDALKAAIAKAGARLDYVQAQLTRTSTLARQSFESQQSLDQAENDAASARADVSEAQANCDAAGNVRSPTRRCRQRPPQSPCSSAGLTRWCCVLPRTASSPSSPQRSARMPECPLCA
jgi:multidrug efflux pump subunit AcrA (membrane-fusion protein)